MHCVLKHWHPMVGVDYHIPWPPGSPSPAPSPVPYQTGYLMCGLFITCKTLDTVHSDSWGITMAKGTDIGPMIPHIGAPSLTLPAEMIFSASKSHFSSSRYQARGQPIAVALLVTVNPNLNCGTPFPTPTGFVLAFTTHVMDMSFGDIFAGVGAMFGDWCVQTALNWLGGKLGSAISRGLMRLVRPHVYFNAFSRYMLGGGSEAGARYFATSAVLRTWRGMERVVGPVIGLFVGGPMGADIGTLGAPTPGGATGDFVSGAYEDLGREAGSAVDNYLNEPSPGVGNHP